MGRPSRRKKGRAAKAARQGLLGLSASAIGKKKSKQFEKRAEQRLRKKDEQRDVEEVLRANGTGTNKPADETRPPHSFVIHTGRVGRYVRQLERDLRRLMSPHTSKELKVTKRNNFKDFVINSQFLGVSHLMVLTRTSSSVNFRICRNPQGPTLHFKVEKYSLSRDILAAQKRPVFYEELFEHPPLVILNGFGGAEDNKKHLQLVQTVVQNMFPTIDVDRLKLATIRRALLLFYDSEEDIIQLRHYSIKAVPAGVSRSAKKLLQNKIPDLSKYEDISDFMLKPGQLSDSEFEGEQVELELPQDIGGRGKKKGQRTKLRLLEIGPRMTLKLTKIEEGINEGEVLYHAFVQKTVKEIAQLRKDAPKIKKKRLRHEKQVEHLAIRRMRNQAEKEVRLAEMDEKERRTLIERQREVTGDYSGGGADEDGGEVRTAINDEVEADDESEAKQAERRTPRRKLFGKGTKRPQKMMGRGKKSPTAADEGVGAKKASTKGGKAARKGGSRFK